MNVNEYNSRLDSVEYSVISKMVEKANSMDNVIHLEVGDVDYDLPINIKREIVKALDNNMNHYPAANGNPKLIDEIIFKEKNNNKVIDSTDIYITSGGSAGMFLALLSILNEGDKVLIFEPTWSHFEEMVKIIGGMVIKQNLEPENNYHLTEEILDQINWKEIKVVLISTPNNPTGTIYSADEIDMLIKYARKNQTAILCDREYDAFTYDNEVYDMYKKYDKCVVSKSFSKIYSMAGLRLGYVVGNSKWIEKIRKSGFYSFMYSSSMIQSSLIRPISNTDEFVKNMVEEFKERAQLCISELAKCNRISCNMPEGAVYLWVDCRKISMDDIYLSELLLNEAKIAVVPGSSFGKIGKGFIRISLGCEKKQLVEAMKSIVNVLDNM